MEHFKRDEPKMGDERQAAGNAGLRAEIPPPSSIFAEFEHGLQTNQLNFIRDHIDSYEPFERMMGFQCFINNKVATVYGQDRTLRHASDQVMAENAILTILEQNILYLFSALRPLEQESIHAYRALVRPVLESVPKCFFLMGHPENIRKFLLAEKYDAWEAIRKHKSGPKSEKFLKSAAAREVPGTEKITAEELGKFVKEHGNRQLRAKIYHTNTVKLQDRLYSVLSTSSHADMLRYHPLENTSESKAVSMKILTDLSFFNLFLMVNSQHGILRSLGLLKTAKRFVADAQQSLKHHLEITHLYPDEKEYLEKLVLKPKHPK